MKAQAIRYALILDTETTGLNPEMDATIEVACALYDIEYASVVASFASLIQCDHNSAELVNRIPVRLLIDAPISGSVWPQVVSLALRADVIVAHRAEFDIQFVPKELQKLKPWACSKFDMDFPCGKPERGEHLVHLALAHDVPVYTAHRAMADVDTLVRTFQAAHRLNHDVSNMIARSLRPKGVFQALVSFNDKDKAKEAGFSWNPEAKTWSRRMFVDEVSKLPFKTTQLKAL
jgi:DNA polymerase-3 subunit epsilon